MHASHSPSILYQFQFCDANIGLLDLGDSFRAFLYSVSMAALQFPNEDERRRLSEKP